MTKASTLPFRWILPLAQLIFCAALLWPIWPEIGRQTHAVLRAHGIAPQTTVENGGGAGDSAVAVPDITSPEWRRKLRQKERSERIAAILNGLGGMPEVAYAMGSAAHTAWTPDGMYTWIWLAMSWPILGMLFWFFAGRGVEACLSLRKGLAHPRIRWWEVAPALLMIAYGGGLAGAMLSGNEYFETPWWRIFLLIGLMWFAFGVNVLWAGWRQGRLRKAPSSR